MSSKPCGHLKGLDLGVFVAAPFRATALAEFRAEAIKIDKETPRERSVSSAMELHSFGCRNRASSIRSWAEIKLPDVLSRVSMMPAEIAWLGAGRERIDELRRKDVV